MDQEDQNNRANIGLSDWYGRIQIANFNFLKLIKYHNRKNFTHEKGDDRCLSQHHCYLSFQCNGWGVFCQIFFCPLASLPQWGKMLYEVINKLLWCVLNIKKNQTNKNWWICGITSNLLKNTTPLSNVDEEFKCDFKNNLAPLHCACQKTNTHYLSVHYLSDSLRWSCFLLQMNGLYIYWEEPLYFWYHEFVFGTRLFC